MTAHDEAADAHEPTAAEVAARAMAPSELIFVLDTRTTAHQWSRSFDSSQLPVTVDEIHQRLEELADQVARRDPLEAAAETDARLAAGEDVERAARQDATVRRLLAAGDPAVRSPFYGEDDG